MPEPFKQRVKRNINKCKGFIYDFSLYIPNTNKAQKVPTTTDHYKVLVLGVVLEYKRNLFEHISERFSSSKQHHVTQVWALLKPTKRRQEKEGIFFHYYNELEPRSEIINSLYKSTAANDYDFIFIVDDDIRLPENFVDDFLKIQSFLDFSLAQPARSLESIVSHSITRQRPDLLARETRFVEIGPVVCIRKDIQTVILPLDTSTPMGWGLDYIWPYQIREELNKKIGIIDAVCVGHTLRPTARSYDVHKSRLIQKEYLSTRNHYSEDVAHTEVKAHDV